MTSEDFLERIQSTFESVEGLLGHHFKNHQLLLQALTHSSFSNEVANTHSEMGLDNNERLEFLGDAVIGLVIAGVLMERYPTATEGSLSRWRSSLVSRKTLAEIAGSLGLGEVVLLGRGERRTGGAAKRSILAAIIEALVGALYLDGGLEVTSQFLVKIYGPWLSSLTADGDRKGKLLDQKTQLQETVQSKFRTTPAYKVVDSWGPEHEKEFRVEIQINGKVIATGDGRSKKEAEQAAAGLALSELEKVKNDE